MTLEFTKMHGLGNDYIYLDCIRHPGYSDIDSRAVRTLADRHTGIGGDGVVLILPSRKADYEMRMFNADGSEGAMCGNAIRCVGKYLFDHRHTDRHDLDIETASGVKRLTLSTVDGKVATVTVDMGTASFAPADIPLTSDHQWIDSPIKYNGINAPLKATVVSVGNPHCVIPMTGIKHFPLEQYGPQFENHTLFPDRVNTEIAEQLDTTHLTMRVWERGSGETMACGTGACATVAAFCRLGLVPFDTDITVSLRGGDLTISCSPDYRLTMTGPATEVFRGEMTIDN